MFYSIKAKKIVKIDSFLTVILRQKGIISLTIRTKPVDKEIMQLITGNQRHFAAKAKSF